MNALVSWSLAELHEKEFAAAAPPSPAEEAPGFAGGDAENGPGGEAKGQSVVPRSGAKGVTKRLDFNSLYPTIIQEFNVCFTTLALNQETKKEKGARNAPAAQASPSNNSNNLATTPALTPPSKSVLEGVLPRVLRLVVEQRRQVKRLLKEEREKAGKETLRAQQLDIRQFAVKLTADPLYGCQGFEVSRFFARPLVEMFTSQGRDTLQKRVDLARFVHERIALINAQVIYGDTNSLFVYTGMEDIFRVRKLGTDLKIDVNKKYRTLEIEIDAIYKKMLLLKKKNCAALKVVDPANPDKTVHEVKGLDLVRHDWCDLPYDASEHFLTKIFEVKDNQVALSNYVIARALTKRQQDYPDGKSLPHVDVAFRLISEKKRRIKPGDYIKYVICKSKQSASTNVATRAYHPDEVMASKGKLAIDVQYYLENQILPPIMRLCDPSESIEASRVAVSLGLDGHGYERKSEQNLDARNYLALGPQSAAEKFRGVEPLLIKCVH